MTDDILGPDLDTKTIQTPNDLTRMELRLRERTLGTLRKLITCRREWLHIWVENMNYLEAHGYQPEDEEFVYATLREQGAKVAQLRSEIKTVIKLMRDIDQSLFEDMGSSPEH